MDYDVYRNQTTSRNQTLSNSLNQYYKKRITATVPIFGRLGSATVYVRFRQGGNNIQRPLIVAEGFDPGVILSREIEAGQNNIIDFIDSYLTSQSQLPNELQTYDLIYVDWDNGVDFLQRNAMVFEEVIRWVNQEKASNGSTIKNVVLGQSMGGLVARYALRDIELNRNFNHDTRLYVSHDAPHLGANVPYSVQYSARHLRNLYIQTPVALLTGDVVLPMILNFADGITTISNQFLGTNLGQFNYVSPLQAFSLADVPAARQMQYTWVSNNYAINNTIHQSWMQEYNNLGFPQGYSNSPLRNISVANGSECGVLQPENANIMSYVKDAGRDTFLSNYIGILDAVYGSLLIRPDIVFVALFPGKSYWEIDFQSRYMTNLNQNKQIYRGSIKYKKKVFWFIPVSITVTNRTVNQPSNILPYDIYGGGFERTSPSSIPIAGSTLVSNAYGFIPTASALAIGSGSTVINDTDYRRSYVGALPPVAPKNTQFHNFVTHFDSFNPNNNNSRHISFNRRNGNWLRSELNVNVPDEITNCSFICNASQITGADVLCNSSVYTAPASATFYNWTITQGANLVTLTGNGTSNVTLTALPSASGEVTLSLTLGDNNWAKCGNVTINKTIWVGKAVVDNVSFSNGIGEEGYFCSSHINNEFTIYPSIQGNTYQYRILGFPSLNVVYTSPLISSNSGTVSFTPAPGWYVFEARMSNSCGTSDWFATEIEYVDCSAGLGGAAQYEYFAYPNPTSKTLTIESTELANATNYQKGLFNSTSLSSKSDNVKNMHVFKIYDFKGNEVISGKLNSKTNIDVSTLKKGTYILEINANENKETHKIIIE